MSRNFDLTIRIKGIKQAEIVDFLEHRFGHLDVTSDAIEQNVYIGTGIVTLCCGQSDFEAHKEISEYFKNINPTALVRTRWTYLDDLPFETYGDDFLEDEDE